MKLITQSIQTGVSFAYISLLVDLADMLTSPLSLSIGEMDQDLGAIIQDIKKRFSSLDILIGADEKSRGECIQNLQHHHKILEEKYQALNGYNRELSHIAFDLEEKYHIQNTPPESIQGINYHQFIHEALDFISQSETEKEKTYKIQEVLRFIPMRMTKDSFGSYIRHSLAKVSPGKGETSGTLFLSVFKQMFDGRFTPHYHEVFYDLAIAIEDIREKSKTDLSSEDIATIFDDLYLLKDTAEELYHMLTLLHTTISKMSVLLILDNLSFDILSDEHVAFKDLFFTMQSLIDGEIYGEDYHILLETLPDRLGNIYDEIDENYNQCIDKLDAALKKGSLPQTEQNLKSIKLFSLIRFYLLLDIQDAFGFHESADNESSLPQEVIDAATEFLKEQLDELKPAERKLRMQYLISVLPFTMDDRQFATYFNDGLEGTSNEIKKVHVLAKISSFMESCGYFEAQAHEEHHHHEEHDHDCGHHH